MELDKKEDIVLVRVEQIYPMPKKKMDAIIEQYKNATPIWVQEEPENMGAWTFIRMNYDKINTNISRPMTSSPATGFSKLHEKEQKALVERALE